ncbi:hypothetical protein NL518_28090, partial [Klebsiella pneumoniae]|nr:hypothetical protein [Klebsiella pneumoniae]
AKAEQRKNAPQKPRQTNSLGLTVSDLTAEQMKTLKLKNGVQIDGVADFLKKFFERDDILVRFRPSYFPFTEPSAEIDMMFEQGKNAGKWL